MILTWVWGQGGGCNGYGCSDDDYINGSCGVSVSEIEDGYDNMNRLPPYLFVTSRDEQVAFKG